MHDMSLGIEGYFSHTELGAGAQKVKFHKKQLFFCTSINEGHAGTTREYLRPSEGVSKKGKCKTGQTGDNCFAVNNMF